MFGKVDWLLFESLRQVIPHMIDNNPIDVAFQSITDRIIAAAVISISNISENIQKQCKPSWNADCEKIFRKTWNTFLRSYYAKLINFKKVRANFRQNAKKYALNMIHIHLLYHWTCLFENYLEKGQKNIGLLFQGADYFVSQLQISDHFRYQRNSNDIIPFIF